MEQAIIAVGSNLGDRLAMIRNAADFLGNISQKEIIKSSIWESEPIGAAKFNFLNCAAMIAVQTSAETLLKNLKNFELQCGRNPESDRWAPRVLDLDIIRFGEKVVHSGNLKIPHPEFRNRLFVLLPVQEIFDGYIDPLHTDSTEKMIQNAPRMEITKTDLKW